MEQAVEYAKLKIKKFPEIYKDYTDDSELFSMLVEDCRKQLKVQRFSINFISMGGVEHGPIVI